MRDVCQRAVHESMRESLKTHKEVHVTALEVIVPVTADTLNGGLDGRDCGLNVLGRDAGMATMLFGGH